MSGLPAWLQRHLENTGKLHPTPHRRHAQIRACTTCGQPVIYALDDDICAVQVDCDPWPLNPLGELFARATERFTYTLQNHGNRFQLKVRWAQAIRENPAGSTDGQDVLASHQCGQPPLPAAPSRIHRNPATTYPERPPF